jgi:MoaA/NifB/PqqE/SkfB family radical SAM enzyme
MACNLKCDYCINSYSGENRTAVGTLSGRKWVEGLNRLVSRDDLPITLQGGEPSLHPDFIWIINNIRRNLNIDILTNLCFDIDTFITEINPLRLRRNAPYANIRVSYHPYYMDLDKLTKDVLKMQDAGFSIGIFGILHPKITTQVLKAQQKCRDLGIDFRTKEFLGEYNKQLHGTYLYPEAVGSGIRKDCLCRTSELIIGPEGGVFRCHHDLYKGFPSIGNLLDDHFVIEDIFRECNEFGDCNPCDIKTKTNRFQIYGHTSVEIKEKQQV